MRLYAPLYEGDSILRPDAAIGKSSLSVFKTPAFAADFVRSNIPVDDANETALDLQAIELQAHAMRNAEVARLLKGAFAAVASWFKAARIAVSDWLERNQNYERDHFFASASDLSDLEQRQRHYEHTGFAHY